MHEVSESAHVETMLGALHSVPVPVGVLYNSLTQSISLKSRAISPFAYRRRQNESSAARAIWFDTLLELLSALTRRCFLLKVIILRDASDFLPGSPSQIDGISDFVFHLLDAHRNTLTNGVAFDDHL